MAVRNVKKSLVGMEDVAQGKGTVSQTRGGGVVELHKMDVPFALDTEAEMSALAVTKYTRARVYSDTVTFIDYIYDDASLDGVESDTGPGTWRLARGTMGYVFNEATLTDARANKKAIVGDAANTHERSTGKGGSGMWDYVLASAVTPNDIDIVLCTGTITLALVLRAPNSLASLGADPLGTTDTKAILERYMALVKIVRLGSGSFFFSDEVDIPEKTALIGEGMKETILNFDHDATLFDGGLGVDGKDNVTLRDFSMTHGTKTTSVGVLFRGTCRMPYVKRVGISGFGANLWLSGYLGAVPGIVSDAAIIDCVVENSAGSFGVVFEDTSRAELRNILARVNATDGIKLRKKNTGININGGVSHDNGQKIAANGNGIDCYAGGFNSTIKGLECYGNDGDGIYIKTGDLNNTDRANFGDVALLSIINCSGHNNTGNGYQISRNSGSNPTDPLVNGVDVVGGRYYANGGHGADIRGRNINVTGGVYSGNQRLGISIGQSIDVTIQGVTNYANCLDGVSLYGMQIAESTRVTVSGGTICGVDNFNITQPSDYDLQAVRHNWSINIHMTGSDDIVIEESVMMSYNIQGQPILISGVSSATASVITHQRGATNPEGVIHGGIGSTYKRVTSGTVNSQLWTKVEGRGDKLGWMLLMPTLIGTTAQRPTFAAIATGTPYYDTTLKLPLWKDGVVWKDAASNIV